MAAVAGVQTVNITINDIELQVPKGELVIESMKRMGIDVPIFCYHPRLKSVGMCRMCLVDMGSKMPDGTVRKFPKPQTACTLPASEGLVIYSDTAQVHKDRKGVLEFLLINHPLDCPICDRGGECPLQNNTLFYGPSTSRYVEIKRHAPKAFPLSPFVTLDLERCIQCGRCVRFTEEISGDSQLAFRFRGAEMQPSTFDMSRFESKFSGNVIEICPVGALTSSKYRFRARPWDLQTKAGICTLCSNGCNVYFDYRSNQIMRVNGRTNEAVNEEWTCDKGKFGHDIFNTADRITQPMIRLGDEMVATEWGTAYTSIVETFRSVGGPAVAALVSASQSNEGLYLLRNLMRDDIGSSSLDYRFEKDLDWSQVNRALMVETSIADFELAKSILVFGTSLSEEEPILFLRVRKAWFKHAAKVVVAHDSETDVDSFADLILRYRPGTAAILANGLLKALTDSGKATATGLDKFTPSYVEQETGVLAADLLAAVDLIAGAPIVTTRGIYNQPEGVEAVSILGQIADQTAGQLNVYARSANEEGAALLGLNPNSGALNTHSILQACADGQVKALWLAGVDPFSAHSDRNLVTKALENVEFLVVQDWRSTESTEYASVVLPMTTPLEESGTLTSLEQRVQRFSAVLQPAGESKPLWRVASELGMRFRPRTPMFNPGEVLESIKANVPAFSQLDESELVGEGSVLR